MTFKQLTDQHNINQAALPRAVGYSPTVINQLINHNQWPKRNPEALRGRIEAYFAELNISLPNDLFNDDEENYSMNKELISQEARKLFNITRDPFNDDVKTYEDVFLSSEQRYIRETLYQAAKHGGFVAIIGESGSGKSTLRRDLVDRIQRETLAITLISPVIPDKTKLTAASITDAIIYDLNPDAHIKRSHEAKSRQMVKLLTDSGRAGNSHCLIIEEAHDLSLPTLKQLKRFWELEDGFKRLLSIILIGQPELHNKLDERMNWEAREVIRRCEIATLNPLGRALADYLTHKFKRVGVELNSLFTEDSISAMEQRLTRPTKDRKVESISYPLIVNNLTVRILNQAALIGVHPINADVVNSI